MKYSLLKVSLVCAFLVAFVVVPMEAHAQFTNIELIVFRLGDIINIATPVIVGLALLVFFWGLVKFIFRAGNEEEREKGKQVMIWGIIALFVMVSIWGIIYFIADAFFINTGPVYYPSSGPGGGVTPTYFPSSSGGGFPTSEPSGGSGPLEGIF